MKTRKNLAGLVLVLALLALLSSSHKASAYYDPGVQRWVNRDPLTEKGGINLYGFVHNEPTGIVDKYGRDFWPFNRKPAPPDPPRKSYWDTVKEMADAVKKAAKDYEDGKCPNDPCKLPSSLNAICTCMYNAAKNNSIDDMIECICQASSDPQCAQKARKAIGGESQ